MDWTWTDSTYSVQISRSNAIHLEGSYGTGKSTKTVALGTLFAPTITISR